MKNTTERNEAKSTQRTQKYENALDNFSRKQVPQREKKKNKWVTPVILLVAIAIGVFLIIRMSAEMGEQQSFVQVFSSVLPKNALLAVVVLLTMLLLDVAKFVTIIHATTGTLRPLVGTKVSFLGKYYDNITPFAAGGQPAQIYYLYNKGFGGGLSSAVVFIKYFFNTFAWLGVAFVAMVCNTTVLNGVSNGNVLVVAGWVGWGVNMVVPVFILLFVVVPRFATKLTSWVIAVGHKLKIVKDKEKTMGKALGVVQDFRSAFVIMAKRPTQLVFLSVCCVAELALSFAFPYFIIKMFNGFQNDLGFATMFQVMGLNAYASLGASVVPTPGGSGALEGMITMAFSDIAGSTLMWVIFTWRFAVFYLYIIIGVGITLHNFIRNLVRARKEKVSVGENSRIVSVELSDKNK